MVGNMAFSQGFFYVYILGKGTSLINEYHLRGYIDKINYEWVTHKTNIPMSIYIEDELRYPRWMVLS